MAEGFGEMVIIYNLLPEFAAQLEETVSKVVRKTAFDIQAQAQANITMNEQIDTSFMKNSVYVVTHNLSTYGEVQPPEKPGQELLPEVERPTEKGEAIVAVGANYGVYQEFGTIKMTGKPYLTPAAELVKPYFMEALSHLEEAMAANAVGGEGGGE